MYLSLASSRLCGKFFLLPRRHKVAKWHKENQERHSYGVVKGNNNNYFYI